MPYFKKAPFLVALMEFDLPENLKGLYVVLLIGVSGKRVSVMNPYL